MPSNRIAIVLSSTLVLYSACEVKRVAAPGAPARVEIAVGAETPRVVDLDAIAPDAEDDGRRAWNLRTLYGDAWRTPATVEVTSANGERRELHVAAAESREAFLSRNLHGEMLVALAPANQVFAAFHGRGGNRGRGGDPDRVRGVVRITLVGGGT